MSSMNAFKRSKLNYQLVNQAPIPTNLYLRLMLLCYRVLASFRSLNFSHVNILHLGF